MQSPCTCKCYHLGRQFQRVTWKIGRIAVLNWPVLTIWWRIHIWPQTAHLINRACRFPCPSELNQHRVQWKRTRCSIRRPEACRRLRVPWQGALKTFMKYIAIVIPLSCRFPASFSEDDWDDRASHQGQSSSRVIAGIGLKCSTRIMKRWTGRLRMRAKLKWRPVSKTRLWSCKGKIAQRIAKNRESIASESNLCCKLLSR